MTKRLLCMLLSALLLFSMSVPVFGATFKDVPETNSYYEAIDVLSDFKIILGDATGNTFRPDAEISREEFSVIVTRILGASGIMPDLTELPFTDVTPIVCDEWAIIATKVAYDLGIVSGYGDGKFGPKDPVTYEQVVKMLVCSLGYESVAIQRGGWPTGYILVANDLGITDDAIMEHSKNAPRGIVSQLVYNCLEVDLMTKVNDEKYEVQRGHNILTDKLGYKYGKGIVTGLPGIAFNHLGRWITDGQAEIDNVVYDASNVDMSEYLGFSGEFYYKENGSIKTLVSFTPSQYNKKIVLTDKQLDTVNSTSISYYLTESSKKESTVIAGAVYMYNDSAKPLSSITMPNIGNITIIHNNDDDIADVVLAEDSRVVVASAVDSTNFIVHDKYNPSLKLDLSGNNTDSLVITKNGNPSSFNAITKGTVIMVKESPQQTIANLITNTIKGTVEEVRDSGNTITINGVDYTCAADYKNYIALNPVEQLNVGDKALIAAYDNKILYSEISEITAKIGYLIDAEADTQEKFARVKIYTTANAMSILTCADQIQIDGAPCDYTQVPSVLASAASLTNKDDSAANATRSQLVEYVTDSSGKVSEIYTMKTTGDIRRTLVLNRSYDEAAATYSSTSKNFKNTGITVNSSTKVFFIPSDRSLDDDYIVKGYSGLKNSTNYKFEAFDLSSTGVATAIVIYGNTNVNTITEQTIALITDVTAVLNSDKVAVAKVTLVTNGKSATKTTQTQSVMGTCKVGDIVKYKTDSKGIIVEMSKVFDPELASFTFLNSGAENKRYYTSGSVQTETSAYYLTILGTVYSQDADRIVISESLVGEDGTPGVLDETKKKYTIPFSKDTVFYMYDRATDKLTVEGLTKDNISTYVDALDGASKVMTYNSYTNLRFVYIINN
ncbi:MAG: S-layer homology domain-containing protein [Clostridia bacterium]|nr:S-layer homology domain-containing protein [Clostridia bacterium]